MHNDHPSLEVEIYVTKVQSDKKNKQKHLVKILLPYTSEYGIEGFHCFKSTQEHPIFKDKVPNCMGDVWFKEGSTRKIAEYYVNDYDEKSRVKKSTIAKRIDGHESSYLVASHNPRHDVIDPHKI